MRKLLLIYFFILMICGTCYANDRWEPINQSGELSVYIDSFRARSYGTKEDPYFDCWLKWVDSNSMHIDHTFIRAKYNYYMIRESTWYDSNGNLIQDYNFSQEGWKTPTPDSVMEYTIHNAITWGSNKGY